MGTDTIILKSRLLASLIICSIVLYDDEFIIKMLSQILIYQIAPANISAIPAA